MTRRTREPNAGARRTDVIVVATGLPRSGTSLLMQMLRAGGVRVLADDERPPDASNPRGYLEYAPVKAIARDASWLPRARGRAVKIVAPLLAHLPASERYVVLWMERDLREVLASQAAMLARTGESDVRAVGEDALRCAFEAALERADAALERLGATVLRLGYADTIAAPARSAQRMRELLGDAFDATAAAAAVDARLHRQRVR